MNNNFVYKKKEDKSLRADFGRRVNKNENAFIDYNDFKAWYDDQIKVCNYCGLTEEESQEIVVTKLLTSNRFPQNGVPGRGTSRGMFLEVDRVEPKGNYSRNNCVMCCYFCNNDKSDVFHGNHYKEFFQNRIQYLRNLLEK